MKPLRRRDYAAMVTLGGLFALHEFSPALARVFPSINAQPKIYAKISDAALELRCYDPNKICEQYELTLHDIDKNQSALDTYRQLEYVNESDGTSIAWRLSPTPPPGNYQCTFSILDCAGNPEIATLEFVIKDKTHKSI